MTTVRKVYVVLFYIVAFLASLQAAEAQKFLFGSEAEILTVLSAKMPTGTSYKNVKKILHTDIRPTNVNVIRKSNVPDTRANVRVDEYVERRMYVELGRYPSKTIVRGTALDMVVTGYFDFDDHDRLTKIQVKKALEGP